MKRHNIKSGQLRRVLGSEIVYYVVLGPHGRTGRWRVMTAAGELESWWWDLIDDDEVVCEEKTDHGPSNKVQTRRPSQTH